MPAPIIIVLGIVALAPTVLAGAGQFFPPIGEKAKHVSFDIWPNKLPEITELAMMRVRETITEDEYFSRARQEGFNHEVAENYWIISFTLLNAYDYITLWRREKMDENKLDENLAKLALSSDDIENLKVATEYFPGPQDLIRFAVREVYTSDIAKEFGIFQELPPEFVSEGKKIGIQEEQARNHWGAHWVLPSINMGFEMLHRRIIDEGTTAR
ncbi:hypothetical protein LCGC14_2454330, partial [marine sediment metagenome]